MPGIDVEKCPRSHILGRRTRESKDACWSTVKSIMRREFLVETSSSSTCHK